MVWIGRTRYNTQLMTSEAQSFAEIERDSTQIERGSRGKITAASLYVTFQRNANNATSRPEILVPPLAPDFPHPAYRVLPEAVSLCLFCLSVCLPPPSLSFTFILARTVCVMSRGTVLWVSIAVLWVFFSAPLYPRTARRYRNRFYCYYYYFYFCLSACFAARDKIWSLILIFVIAAPRRNE